MRYRYPFIIVALFCAFGLAAAQHSVSVTATPSPTPGVKYNLYRDGARIGSALTMPAALDAMVVNGSSYRYTMRAVDANGLESIDSNAATVTVPQDVPPVGCFMSAASWTNGPLITPATAFDFTTAVTTSAAGMDGVLGLSAVNAGAYGDLAAMIRTNAAGYFDAFDGATGAYSAAVQVPYVPGMKYSVRMRVDPVAKTYDAFVTDGGSEKQIGAGLKFRAQAVPLISFAVIAETGSFTACNAAVTPVSAPPPPPPPPPAPAPVTMTGVFWVNAAPLKVGTSVQLRFFAKYSDGTTADITPLAAWTSSSNSRVAISSTGLATVKTAGLVTITATLAAKTQVTTIK